METLELLEQLEIRAAQRKMFTYKPYGHPDTLCPNGKLWKKKFEKKEWDEWSNKPWQLDFHHSGTTYQERMLCSANRVGKTECAAAEIAYHMTGDYPEWWEGIRFEKPVLVWTGSPTNETSRDIVQKALLGGTDKETLGTGFIPRERIVGKPKARQAGVSDVVDTFKVRHISGGVSTCVLKTYEQGWRKWQGTAPDVVWMDEEPEDFKCYTEALTRLLTSHGTMLVTFTPLLGQTELVLHFQTAGSGIYLDGATWDDAPHLNKEEKKRMANSYPDYEVQARTMGVPMMGEGRIFTVSEEDIIIQPFHVPRHYGRIKGIDFGRDHPAAVADLAWDRDRDIVYVTRTWKKKPSGTDQFSEHIQAINEVDSWVPVAWPHDGAKRGAKDGVQLKDHYKRKVKMLSRSARFKTEIGGSQSIEAQILMMQDRLDAGGLRVFSTCTGFFEEYRNYHRKDGKVVDLRDDILKAVMYGLMMLRYSVTQNSGYQIQDSPPILSMRM